MPASAVAKLFAFFAPSFDDELGWPLRSPLPTRWRHVEAPEMPRIAVDKLRLDLLCTLLTNVERDLSRRPSSAEFDGHGTITYGTVLHHLAFALAKA